MPDFRDDFPVKLVLNQFAIELLPLGTCFAQAQIDGMHAPHRGKCSVPVYAVARPMIVTRIGRHACTTARYLNPVAQVYPDPLL